MSRNYLVLALLAVVGISILMIQNDTKPQQSYTIQVSNP